MKKYLMFALLAGLLSGNACSMETEPIALADADTTLHPDEINDLLWIREEEKLARDVYLYALDQYDMRIFENISASEQRHMDRILELLEHYELEDPVKEDARGQFTHPDLKKLYLELTQRVDQSLVEALKVGALIEDLDLNDLNLAIDKTTKTNITAAYQVLRCGSKNHIQAFVKQLKNQGNNYDPQFISTDFFQEILAGGHQSCHQ
jgi:hypothetical protein